MMEERRRPCRLLLGRTCIALVVCLLPRLSSAASWAIDPAATRVEFRIRHLLVSSVSGEMRGVAGSAVFDEADLARTRVEARIDAASIDTGNAERDQDLRSADFFDAGAHPTIHFTSTRVEALSPGRYRISGDLTVRGVTNPIILEVGREPAAVESAAITATARATLSRSAFGIEYSRALIGDEVEIAIAVRLVRQPSTE